MILIILQALSGFFPVQRQKEEEKKNYYAVPNNSRERNNSREWQLPPNTTIYRHNVVKNKNCNS